MARDINGLSDPNAMARKKSASRIYDALFGSVKHKDEVMLTPLSCSKSPHALIFDNFGALSLFRRCCKSCSMISTSHSLSGTSQLYREFSGEELVERPMTHSFTTAAICDFRKLKAFPPPHFFLEGSTIQQKKCESCASKCRVAFSKSLRT